MPGVVFVGAAGGAVVAAAAGRRGPAVGLGTAALVMFAIAVIWTVTL
jgi:hypothetical protein